MRLLNKFLASEPESMLFVIDDFGYEDEKGGYIYPTGFYDCIPASYINTIEKAQEYFIEVKNENIEKYREECRKRFYELKEQEEEE